MITYRIVGNNGKALKMIRHRQPLTLAEIAILMGKNKKSK